MPDHVYSAAHWRALAARALSAAAMCTDDQARIILDIALAYEKMAQRAEFNLQNERQSSS